MSSPFMGRWPEGPEGQGRRGRAGGAGPEGQGQRAGLGKLDRVATTLTHADPLVVLDLDDPKKKTILDVIDWRRYRILPNTAGCKTADEAIRIARLARSMGLSDWVKLEVIPDPRYLFPDPEETLKAARVLVGEGFKVLPYINADPVLARKLEEIGTVTVMPLGSPIGSGQGIQTMEQIRIIIEEAHVPVVVDAGIGVPSDAALAMELGADAVLVNTAIALASEPALMAEAIRGGVEAGRKAYLAGRIPKRPQASPSSPTEGMSRPT